MTLRLDHVILRSDDATRDLMRLTAAGLPLAAALTPVMGTMRSGLVRAGSVDIEVLEVGDPPPRTLGYGIGLRSTAGDLWKLAGELRARGIATSAPFAARADHDGVAVRWSALHVAGLLPDPFPVPTTLRPPGRIERLAATLSTQASSIGPVARRATRSAGGSMVVVTEYGFDIDAQRGAAPPAPAVVEVELGVGDAATRWARLGPLDGPTLTLATEGPAGVRAVRLAASESSSAPSSFDLGEVRFEFT